MIPASETVTSAIVKTVCVFPTVGVSAVFTTPEISEKIEDQFSEASQLV